MKKPLCRCSYILNLQIDQYYTILEKKFQKLEKIFPFFHDFENDKFLKVMIYKLKINIKFRLK